MAALAHNVIEVLCARGRELRSRCDDELIAQLAALQHGVVSRAQLLALGVSSAAIQYRLAAGRLHPLYRGVYAVGHPVVSRHGRWLAAVLAAGSGAALSHGSAAALWRIREFGGAAHVTAATGGAPRRGLVIHRGRLSSDESELVDGIPATTVARTILDLARVLEPHLLERTFHEAEYLQLASPTSLSVLLERHPRRPGAPVLRGILERRAHHRTRTDMEAEFLAFCDEHALPRPASDVPRVVGGRQTVADFAYLEKRLIVELDGGSHRTNRRFVTDRSRDRANLAEDWPTVRVTAADLRDDRRALAADLRMILARRPHAIEVLSL